MGNIREPENRYKTDRIIRRGKYVGSSVDYRGGGMRLARHAQAAISKRSSEVKQRHHEELCKEGTEANLRILAVFECDPQIKPYVPIVENFHGLDWYFRWTRENGRI